MTCCICHEYFDSRRSRTRYCGQRCRAQGRKLTREGRHPEDTRPPMTEAEWKAWLISLGRTEP